MQHSSDLLRHGRRNCVVAPQHQHQQQIQAPISLDGVSSSSSRRDLLKTQPPEIEESEAAPATSLMPTQKPGKNKKKVLTLFRSLLDLIPFPPVVLCTSWLAIHSDYPSLGSKVTGTLYGYRKGHVFFAVQEDPRSEPVLLLELATPTNTLVKEMASGLVRIALECERTQNRGKLFAEPVWTMYCNGRRTGYAIRRAFSEPDLQVLSLVRAISMGAGVLPKGEDGPGEEEGPDGELMYMRARFERVVGSRDSEAFYMMNPDGTGGPELSIFLLRI